MNQFARPELIATPEWLAENLDRPGFQVIDVRWRPDGSGRQVYAASHIPTATYIDWREDLVESETGDVLYLAGPQQVTTALTRAGVGNGMVAILYDDTGCGYAARVWWSLRVYGFESARILAGGMSGWEAYGQAVSGALELRPPVSFTARQEVRLRVTTAEVRAMIGSAREQLIDGRTPDEFRGREGSWRRLGHIPGAINLPAAALTEPGTGRFRPAVELAALLKKAGVSRKKRLVCYDTAGVNACKLAFALALLGYDEVAVYDGGWAEWGERLELPIER